MEENVLHITTKIGVAKAADLATAMPGMSPSQHHIGADDNEMQIEYQEWQLKESS